MEHPDPVFLAELTCKHHLYVHVAEVYATEGLMKTKQEKNAFKEKTQTIPR